MKTNMRKTVDYTFFLYNESHDRTIIFKLPRVMISNCTNIYKAKNKLTPATFEAEKTTKIGNPCSTLQQAHNCGSANPV